MAKDAEEKFKLMEQQLRAANQQLRANEKELKKSRQRYKAMFEGSINAIAVYEAVDEGNDFVLKNFNPSAERIEKIKREDVIDKSVLKVFPEAKEFGLFDIFKKVWKTGKSEHFAVSLYKDQSVSGWRDNYVFKLPSGEIVASYEDITKRKQAEERLQAEQVFTDAIVQSMPGLFYMFEKDSSRFVRRNGNWASVTGYSEDELDSMTVLDFFADRELCSERTQEVYGSGSSSMENALVAKSGEKIPYYLTGEKLVIDGKTYLVGVGQDIRERKRAEDALNAANQQLAADEQQLRAANQQLAADEQQLRAANQQLSASEQQLRAANQQLAADEQQLRAANQQLKSVNQKLQKSEERLRGVLRHSPSVIFLKDLQGRYLLVNRRYEELFHVTNEEVQGKTDYDLFPKEFADRFLDNDRKVLSSGIAMTIDEEVPHDDGTHFYLSLKFPVRNDEGKITSVCGVATDITASKQADEALRESEDRYRAIAEDIPVMICRFLPDYELTYVNKAYCRYFEKTSEELVGSSFLPLIFKADREMVMANISALTVESPNQSHEHQAIGADGKIRWQRWTNRGLFDTDGKVIIYQSVGEDVTERKEAEEKLFEYQKQLKSLASELSLAEERQRRRIATELHDRISQSLVISKVKLQSLRHTMVSEDVGDALDEIRDSLGQIIADTRSLTFDLGSPILYELGFETAVSEWLNEQIEEKYGIATVFEDDNKPKPLNDDIRALLFRDVRELLINIVKHAEADNVKVSIKRINQQIQIVIDDDGVGFDVSKLKLMPSREGGFGIFSIRERLEHLGGQIDIDSRVGRGCKVTLAAPLKD